MNSETCKSGGVFPPPGRVERVMIEECGMSETFKSGGVFPPPGRVERILIEDFGLRIVK